MNQQRKFLQMIIKIPSYSKKKKKNVRKRKDETFQNFSLLKILLFQQKKIQQNSSSSLNLRSLRKELTIYWTRNVFFPIHYRIKSSSNFDTSLYLSSLEMFPFLGREVSELLFIRLLVPSSRIIHHSRVWETQYVPQRGGGNFSAM